MKPAAILLIPFFVTSCGLSRPAVERQTFLVAPEPPEGPVGGSRLRLGAVRVAAPFDGLGMVYRRADERYETDFYNEFAALPADMVGEAAQRWLEAAGRNGGGAAERRLEADVAAWYVDFRSTPPAAVLEVRWRLVAERGGEMVAEAACPARVPLSERSPEGAARAHTEALRRALACLAARIS